MTNADRPASRSARADIIAAAIRLIAARGLEGFSLSDVAKECGRSRSLAVHYFGSKGGLVSAVVADLLTPTLPSLPADPSLRTFIEEVTRNVRSTLNNEERRRALHVVLGDVRGAAPYGQAVVAAYTASHRALASRLDAAYAAGELHQGVDVNAQSFAVLALLRGVAFMALLEVPGLDLDALANELTHNLNLSLGG